MVFELLAMPVHILQQCVLLPFCCPRDLACVLASNRRLLSLRRSCVLHLLEALFQGPGAVNGVSWILRHGTNKLTDISLIDWLHCIRDRAAGRIDRASLGQSHTVVVTPGGRALAAGRGKHGVLGASGNMNSFLFTEIDLRWASFPGRIPVAAVACGYEHTLLLTAAGTVHSCGLGDYGRLGHGNEQSLSRATLVESLLDERIMQVAAGEASSVAVSRKGEAFTWGWGFDNLLGHGDENDRLKPTRVSLPEGTFAGEATIAQREEDEEKEDGSGAVLRNIPRSEHSSGAIHERGALVVDRVTCAAAASRIVLGTRAGRILVSGVHEGGFYEFGRLPDRREQCRWVGQPSSFMGDEPIVLVVDSPGGKIHAFTDCKRPLNPSVVGCAREPRQITQGAGASLASQGPPAPHTPTYTPHAPPLEGPAKVATFDDEGMPLPTPSPSPSPACPPRQPLATTKFSTLAISFGVRRGGTCAGDLSVFALDGALGWGHTDVFVAISTEGALLTAEVLGKDSFRERRDDGIVCALTRLEMTPDVSRSLLMVDDGKCIMTSGHGRTGHLGHGGPAYEPTPRVVESALVLGRMIAGSGGLRAPSEQVSILGSGSGGSTLLPTVLEGGAREGTGVEGRGDGGLLAIVDEAADKRDSEEGSEGRYVIER